MKYWISTRAWLASVTVATVVTGTATLWLDHHRLHAKRVVFAKALAAAPSVETESFPISERAPALIPVHHAAGHLSLQSDSLNDEVALPLVPVPSVTRIKAGPIRSPNHTILAHLSIASRLPGVRILIDEADSGQVTPLLTPIAVIPGERMVTLIAPNGQKKRFAIALERGTSLHLDAF